MIQKKLVLDRLQYPIPGICAILTLIYLSPFVGAWLNYLAFSLCIYRLAKYDVRTFSIDYCCLISVAAVFVLPSGISFVVVLCLIAEVWFVIRDGLAINSALALLVLLVCYLLLRMQFAVSDFLLCVSQFIATLLITSLTGAAILYFSAKKLGTRITGFFDFRYLIRLLAENIAAVTVLACLRNLLESAGLNNLLILLLICGTYYVILLALNKKRLIVNLKEIG